MSQYLVFQIPFAVVGIDKPAILIAGYGIHGKVAALKILLQRN